MRNPAMPADGTSEPLSSLSSADVSLPFSSLGSSSQDKQSLSPTSVPHNIRPNTLNTSGSEAYWFAHAADPPHERIPSRQNDTPTSERPDEQLEAGARRYLDDNQTVESDTSPGSRAGAAFARARGNLVSPGPNNEYKEDASPLSQKEREERFRQFKERQEEERQRRLHELQQQSVLAQKFREQQEEERKRRIDELRQKDLERRMAVEERKRQIWEAEQERKEAILRRNLDREAKIEARRNAQRNSMSFAFGSSTPRVIDLDLGGFGRANPGNPFVTLMPSVNGKRNEENDLYKRRAPSTDLLDQKPDEFDSFDSPLDYHKRSPTDPKQLNRRSFAGMSSEATKACLTIPDYNHSYALGREHPMSSSHHDLWSNTFSSFGWLSGTGVIIGEDPMSRSMVILPSASRGRRRTDLTPTIPWERESSIRSHSPASSTGLSASKRAVSMSRLDILAQPRRRYVVDHSPSTSNIASSISHSGTGCSTSGNTTPGGPRTTSSKLRKDSPSRPRSSMSGASEVSGTSSMASTVSMRSHSGPRRPRPASMAAAIPDATQQIPTPPQRQSRTERKNVPVGVTPPRPPRAKSVGPDALPPPKPPPRRTSPAKSVQSEPVVTANDKPVASVLPNTIEATPVPKPELSSDALSAQEPMIESAGPAKVIPPEPEKPKVAQVTSEVSKPSKDDDSTTGEQTQQIPGTIAKPRITSEEEAKAALAEKRRLAREQAEREAKLERQRQEELQRQEEERIRREEEEQRRMEEEQIRLAVELRRQEEEKLQRAIKEQEEREVEEKKRQEEEVKLKAEKEEQEKKAKEEAEKLRKEAEEKLKKEEEERAERKRRVEQIMKRTRAGKAADAQKEDQISTSEQSMVSAPNQQEETRVNGQPTTDSAPVAVNDIPITEVVNSEVLSDSNIGDNSDSVKVNSASATVLTDQQTLGLEQNGLSQINSVSSEIAPMAKCLVESQNKLEHYNGTVIQTNGYSNLGDSFKEDISTSSDVKGDTKVENLLDFDSFPQGALPIGSSSPPPPPAQFDELIDLSQLPATTTLSNVASNENEVNLFNQESDDLNSNRMVSNNPFIAFEDNVTKKQEATFTDLLS